MSPHPSQPVLWHQLITEMEAFTKATGWGLAGTWGLIHRGDYAQARAQFDEARQSATGARPIPGNPACAREDDQPPPPRPCIICGRPVEPSRTATGWATCTDCGRRP